VNEAPEGGEGADDDALGFTYFSRNIFQTDWRVR
jgi:hypothetical protein